MRSLNLKADLTDRVYAAVKSSLGSASPPLTALLVRDPTPAGRGG
jgi:hypothetical protein